MELNENADIDTSQVEDQRGSGGGRGGIGGLPIPIGGGGLTGIVITLLLVVGGAFFGVNTLGDGGGSEGDNTNLQQACADRAGALDRLECRNVLYVNSIQAYWKSASPEYFGKPYKPASTT